MRIASEQTAATAIHARTSIPNSQSPILNNIGPYLPLAPCATAYRLLRVMMYITPLAVMGVE